MSAGILERIDADLIEPQRLAECVIDQIKIERRKSGDAAGRPLSAREGLIALHFEAHFVAVAAQNMAQGMALEADDLARLMVAWARIAFIANVGAT